MSMLVVDGKSERNISFLKDKFSSPTKYLGFFSPSALAVKLFGYTDLLE